MYQRASQTPLKKPTNSYSTLRNQPSSKDPRQRCAEFSQIENNKLHSSSSSSTRNTGTNFNTRIKAPQQILESYYVQHTKGQTSTRQMTTSNSQMYSFTEGRELPEDPKSLPFNSTQPLLKSRPNVSYFEGDGHRSYRKTETSPIRNDMNRSMQNLDNSKIRKTLTKEMRISLGAYAIEKIVLKSLKRTAINRLDKFKGQQPLGSSQKFKQHFMDMGMGLGMDLMRRHHSPFEKKNKDLSMNFEKEQNLADLSYSTRIKEMNKRPNPLEALMKNGSHTARATSSNRNISFENLNSARSHKPEYPRSTVNPSESSSRGEKTPSQVKKDEETMKAQRRERAFKIIEKAIITIQRAYRRYLRKKKIQKESLSSLSSHRSARHNTNKSPRRERELSNNHAPPPLMIERKNDSGSQVLIEQLTSELNLAKKKMSYLQKENEKAIGELKRIEKTIEATVAERLTIERARVKDSLKEYSTFIDKLLAEKKDLENKSESQAKLIKELCTRLEENALSISKELDALKNEKQSIQNEYDRLCHEARELYLEKKNMIPLNQYQEVLQERDAMKAELSEIKAKLHNNMRQGGEQVNQANEPSFLTKMGVHSVEDLIRAQYNVYHSNSANPKSPKPLNNNEGPPPKEQEIKSARMRESPEFSFDARNGVDMEFNEPFRLSVTLEENYESNRKSPRKENKSSPSKIEGKPFLNHHHSPQSNNNGQKNGKKDLELKNVEEDLNSDLDDLIANLNQRLSIVQGAMQENNQRESMTRKSSEKENQKVLGEIRTERPDVNTIKGQEEDIPKMAGKQDVKFGVLDTLKKAENIFQKLGKTIPKSLN